MIGYMTIASVSDVSKKLTNVSCFSPWSHAQGLDVGCSWTKKKKLNLLVKTRSETAGKMKGSIR